MLMLNTSQKSIQLGQYGYDHISRLEKVKENQLNFYLNDSYSEQFITLSIRSNYVPVILQKLKEDCSEIELILLGYLSSPIDDSDHDALLQKVIDEILNQQEEDKKLDTSKQIILSFYEENL